MYHFLFPICFLVFINYYIFSVKNIFQDQCGSWINYAKDFKYSDGYICAQLRTNMTICNKKMGEKEKCIGEICEYKYFPDCYFTNNNINICLDNDNGHTILL